MPLTVLSSLVFSNWVLFMHRREEGEFSRELGWDESELQNSEKLLIGGDTTV